MVGNFRKKPVVIQALQWTGENFDEVKEFCSTARYAETAGGPDLAIPTLEGDHRASKNDFIIRGVKGEFYPCKPDIFESTYEKAD